MNKIMELADEYAEAKMYRTTDPQARAALAAEVQAHIDYTSVVIAERDALLLDVKRLEFLRAADQRIFDWYEHELDSLRKAGQMAVQELPEESRAYKALMKEFGVA